MTDNEIKRALERCSQSLPIVDREFTMCGIPSHIVCKNVLDLINRQQAEIERLKEYPKCVYEYDGDLTDFCLKSPCSNYKTVEQIKAEAIKEFAERLIDEKSYPHPNELNTRIVYVSDIKEMVGDE